MDGKSCRTALVSAVGIALSVTGCAQQFKQEEQSAKGDADPQLRRNQGAAAEWEGQGCLAL
jgi:hypothetical protein